MISRKVITLLMYVIMVILLFIIQPSMFFDHDGNIKSFNFEVSDKTTLIPIILILPVLAIIAYLIVLVLEMIFT